MSLTVQQARAALQRRINHHQILGITDQPIQIPFEVAQVLATNQQLETAPPPIDSTPVSPFSFAFAID